MSRALLELGVSLDGDVIELTCYNDWGDFVILIAPDGTLHEEGWGEEPNRPIPNLNEYLTRKYARALEAAHGNK